MVKVLNFLRECLMFLFDKKSFDCFMIRAIWSSDFLSLV